MLALARPSVNEVWPLAANQNHRFNRPANDNNITSGLCTRTKYTYDAADRLKTVTQGGTTTSFAYDGLGRRLKQTVGSTQTRYLWCGAAICQERSNTDVVLRRFTAEGEYVLTGTKKYLTLTDHLGSVRDLVDITGTPTLVGSFDYTPYGVTARSWGTVTPGYTYAGLFVHPQTGLLLSATRAYEPAKGKWLNRDPIGEEGGLNLTGYVEASPMMATDPDGTCPWCAAIGGLGNLGYQLYKNGGNFKCVNWWEVGSWALAGAGAGIVGRAGLTGAANFFSYAAKFKDISRAYWAARGGANGMSLDHWMFSQAAGRSGAVPESIVNGGWNLLEMPLSWNKWLGFAPRWGGAEAAKAFAARLGIQIGVPSVAAASGYAGFQIGNKAQEEQEKQCGCK